MVKRLVTVIGIDPGKSGGIAVIKKVGLKYRISSCKMPSTDKDLFDFVSSHKPNYGVLEKVNSMPGEGHKGAFTFGYGFGALNMVMIAKGISYELALPRTWQKGLGIRARKKTESKTQWKNFLKAKAQQLFPSEKVTLYNADALLIAEYALRKFE